MTVVRFTYVLILFGAILMLLCILKFRTNVQLSKGLFSKNSVKISLISGFQQVLMMFFFAGYVIVLYSLLQKIHVASIFFIGVIFFFGAIFVFLGILLQTDMLSWIKSEHKDLIKTNQQLLQTEAVTILALAYQAELRDLETGKHLERTSHYVKLLAEELSRLPKYHSYLTPAYIADLVKSAPLHDIGKVAIPDSILRKPGKLTPEEFEIMKKHCEYGTRVLKIADEKLSFQSFLKIAIQIAASHHEKWNGKGYPEGLKGEAIPLSGRIMALADVYDAIRSERCYKKSFSHEETLKIIAGDRGEHFDPDLVDVFLRIENNFHEISNTLAG
jgi:response regulator RpfG family c-di-GMP phosphodiesterase